LNERLRETPNAFVSTPIELPSADTKYNVPPDWQAIKRAKHWQAVEKKIRTQPHLWHCWCGTVVPTTAKIMGYEVNGDSIKPLVRCVKHGIET
jgi:hypothetical protein